MTDKTRALLGDQEAAKRLMEKGVLLECPGCGGDDLKECYACGDHFVACKICGWTGPMKNSPAEASLARNTRAPILSSEEMEMLDGKD